jgi:DNA repair exonuclease SbcCD ATPase subunit
MTDTNADLKAQLDALQTSADWELIDTRQRTARVCELYLIHEGQIPVWTKLRETVGRGSSQTIQKAKKEFLAAHASEFRKLAGHVSGIPDALQHAFRQLWVEALAKAEASFEQQRVKWLEDLQQAGNRAEAAEAESIEARQLRHETSIELAAVKQALDRSLGQIDTEIENRRQAESMASAFRESLEKQKEALSCELEDNKQALYKALDRLQSTEDRMMLDIDRVKTQSQAQIDRLSKQQSREKAIWESEKSRLETSIVNLTRELHQSQADLSARQQQMDFKETLLAIEVKRNQDMAGEKNRLEQRLDEELLHAREREVALTEEIRLLRNDNKMLAAKYDESIVQTGAISTPNLDTTKKRED